MNTAHYPSLELCDKLTEIGFPKTIKTMVFTKSRNEIMENPENFYIEDDLTSFFVCPSVIEMLDVMPDSLPKNDEWRLYPYSLEMGKLFVAYSYNGLARKMFDGNLPNALAKMILWLHENKYITF